MDPTERKITKIAREAGKFTVQAMKEEGIGTAEFDFIHLVRHHPGITQTEVREQLKIDKGAAARRAASLEAKGYLIRKPNPWDGRSQLLYATEKAETLKSCKRMVRQLKKCYGICWNCGRPFTQSRTDQLFCSAKCRNKYRYTPVPRCKNCTAPDCAIRDEQRAYAPKACPERNH